LSLRPIPEGILEMRMQRLREHGVAPDLVRELADQQIRAEIAQHLQEDDDRTVPSDEKAEKKRLRYFGADPVVIGMFEQQMNTVHKPGNDPTGKAKRKPPPIPWYRRGFGYES